MEDWIARLYEDAPRFDEGELYQSLAYTGAIRAREKLRRALLERYGWGIGEALDQFGDTFFDEMELEAQHFFREGCLAGRRKK